MLSDPVDRTESVSSESARPRLPIAVSARKDGEEELQEVANESWPGLEIFKLMRPHVGIHDANPLQSDHCRNTASSLCWRGVIGWNPDRSTLTSRYDVDRLPQAPS
jgi:hypothetical protein